MCTLLLTFNTDASLLPLCSKGVHRACFGFHPYVIIFFICVALAAPLREHTTNVKIYVGAQMMRHLHSQQLMLWFTVQGLLSSFYCAMTAE